MLRQGGIGAVCAMAFLLAALLPAPASALTGPEWAQQADATCAKPAAKDRRMFNKGAHLFHKGRFDKSAHVFLRAMRIELGYAHAIDVLPRTGDATFDGWIDDWVKLQTHSAKARIAFARAVLARKPFRKVIRLDKAAGRTAFQASKVAEKLMLTRC